MIFFFFLNNILNILNFQNIPKIDFGGLKKFLNCNVTVQPLKYIRMQNSYIIQQNREDKTHKRTKHYVSACGDASFIT